VTCMFPGWASRRLNRPVVAGRSAGVDSRRRAVYGESPVAFARAARAAGIALSLA